MGNAMAYLLYVWITNCSLHLLKLNHRVKHSVKYKINSYKINFFSIVQRSNEDHQGSFTMKYSTIRIQPLYFEVDKIPLAVGLCKVAFWLEAHDPGKPLSFLDHHIKCGDAIVGLTHKEELENGIAREAFKKKARMDQNQQIMAPCRRP